MVELFKKSEWVVLERGRATDFAWFCDLQSRTAELRVLSARVLFSTFVLIGRLFRMTTLGNGHFMFWAASAMFRFQQRQLRPAIAKKLVRLCTRQHSTLKVCRSTAFRCGARTAQTNPTKRGKRLEKEKNLPGHSAFFRPKEFPAATCVDSMQKVCCHCFISFVVCICF